MTEENDFFKFPHTPHLVWTGKKDIRGDKVLDSAELARFLSSDLIVEEKVDGTNVGISVSPRGLRVQSRGSFVEPSDHPQFAPLRGWLRSHETSLVELLDE